MSLAIDTEELSARSLREQGKGAISQNGGVMSGRGRRLADSFLPGCKTRVPRAAVLHKSNVTHDGLGGQAARGPYACAPYRLCDLHRGPLLGLSFCSLGMKLTPPILSEFLENQRFLPSSLWHMHFLNSCDLAEERIRNPVPVPTCKQCKQARLRWGWQPLCLQNSETARPCVPTFLHPLARLRRSP